MGKMPLVSVVIPVYNGQNTLYACLNSVLEQTFTNYEVIVIDNNSTDKTKKIILDFAEKDGRVKYVYEHFRSRGAARNAGIIVSKGDIIIMTDSDCVVPKDWIEMITKNIRNKRYVAVQGFEYSNNNGFFSRNIQKSDYAFMRNHVKNGIARYVDTKNFAIKSSILKKYMFDSKLKQLEDYDLAIRLRDKYEILFCEDIKVIHKHKTSLFPFIRMVFSRAYYSEIVYRKRKYQLQVGTDDMLRRFDSRGLKKYFSTFFNYVMIKKIDELLFILIHECIWRVGVIWSKIRIL